MAIPAIASQTGALSAPRFGQARTTFGTAPVLFSTDIDDTLVHWTNQGLDFNEVALQGTVKAVNAHRNQLAVHLNTGRGLSSVQQAAARTAPILKNLPVDFLSLNNGLELYVNKGHERTDQWISRLTEADQDPAWRAAVAQRTGWQFDQVRATREQVLLQNGFQRRDSDGPTSSTFKGQQTWVKTVGDKTLMVQCFGNQPGFKFSQLVPPADAGKPAGQTWGLSVHRIARKMLGDYHKMLGRQGIQTVPHWMNGQEGSLSFGIYTVTPKGTHKGTAIQGVLDQYLPHAQAVVTAGDHHYNDTDSMRPRGYRHSSDQTFLPNYPILSGDNTILTKRLKDRPRTEKVETGYLGPALDRQMAKIEPKLRLDRQA